MIVYFVINNKLVKLAVQDNIGLKAIDTQRIRAGGWHMIKKRLNFGARRISFLSDNGNTLKFHTLLFGIGKYITHILSYLYFLEEQMLDKRTHCNEKNLRRGVLYLDTRDCIVHACFFMSAFLSI